MEANELNRNSSNYFQIVPVFEQEVDFFRSVSLKHIAKCQVRSQFFSRRQQNFFEAQNSIA